MKLVTFMLCLAFSIQGFAQRIDVSMIPYRKGDLWGYASPDKQILIKPQYADAAWFSEGLAAVKKGNKWGYINRQGKIIIPVKYTVAKPFRKGFMPKNGKEGGDSIIFAGASLRTDGTEICINAKGQTLLKCPAIAESAVAENRVPIETKTVAKQYSIPNADGLFDKIIDDYTIPGTGKSFYIAQKNNNYGIFSSTFDTIVPFEYNSISYIGNAAHPYLIVDKGGLKGILTPDGKTIVSPEYSNIEVVDAEGQDLLIAKKQQQSYLKKFDNSDLLQSPYSDIRYDNGGFVTTGDQNKKGYYFLDKTRIEPKYNELRRINHTPYLWVKTSTGKEGYINKEGLEFFEE